MAYQYEKFADRKTKCDRSGSFFLDINPTEISTSIAARDWLGSEYFESRYALGSVVASWIRLKYRSGVVTRKCGPQRFLVSICVAQPPATPAIAGSVLLQACEVAPSSKRAKMSLVESILVFSQFVLMAGNRNKMDAFKSCPGAVLGPRRRGFARHLKLRAL